MSETLRLLVVGAHPDDAEYKAGGLAALYRRLGHRVRFLSVTDGSAGHHRMSGPELAARRRKEAAAAAAVLGLNYDVWDYPDGRLVDSIEARERLIRAIRHDRPDLILTHRPNDYHPDHRVTSLLVQDSAYLLTVPAICPDAEHLSRDPVIGYLSDDFRKPYPLQADVVVDVTSVWDDKIAMLDAHRSQFYEWLPANVGRADEVPQDEEQRRGWLSNQILERSRSLAGRHRSALVAAFGDDQGSMIDKCEIFEICEYGSPLDEVARARLFPFSRSRPP